MKVLNHSSLRLLTEEVQFRDSGTQKVKHLGKTEFKNPILEIK